MKRPQKEVLFISDKIPRPRLESREYLATLIRRQRANDQFLVWRENGEIRVRVISWPKVVLAIRNASVAHAEDYFDHVATLERQGLKQNGEPS